MATKSPFSTPQRGSRVAALPMAIRQGHPSEGTSSRRHVLVHHPPACCSIGQILRFLALPTTRRVWKESCPLGRIPGALRLTITSPTSSPSTGPNGAIDRLHTVITPAPTFPFRVP